MEDHPNYIPDKGKLLAPATTPVDLDALPNDVKAYQRPRITRTHQVVHTNPGESPKSLGCPAVCYDLETEGESFERVLRVSPETWLPLASQEVGCWVTSASLLILENTEGRSYIRIPTERQKREVASRVIEVGVCLNGPDDPVFPVAYLPPGRCLELPNPELSRVYLRAASGVTRCRVAVVPR